MDSKSQTEIRVKYVIFYFKTRNDIRKIQHLNGCIQIDGDSFGPINGVIELLDGIGLEHKLLASAIIQNMHLTPPLALKMLLLSRSARATLSLKKQHEIISKVKAHWINQKQKWCDCFYNLKTEMIDAFGVAGKPLLGLNENTKTIRIPKGVLSSNQVYSFYGMRCISINIKQYDIKAGDRLIKVNSGDVKYNLKQLSNRETEVFDLEIQPAEQRYVQWFIKCCASPLPMESRFETEKSFEQLKQDSRTTVKPVSKVEAAPIDLTMESDTIEIEIGPSKISNRTKPKPKFKYGDIVIVKNFHLGVVNSIRGLDASQPNVYCFNMRRNDRRQRKSQKELYMYYEVHLQWGDGCYFPETNRPLHHLNKKPKLTAFKYDTPKFLVKGYFTADQLMLASSKILHVEKMKAESNKVKGTKLKTYRFTQADLARVWPGMYFNDMIVDYYISYLLSQVNASVRKKIHAFSSLFYFKLSSGKTKETCFDNVKSWYPVDQIFEKQYLFIPIIQNNHWSLAVICNPGSLANICNNTIETNGKQVGSSRTPTVPFAKPYILFMDSLKSHRLQNISKYIREYLLSAYNAREGFTSISQEKLKADDVPAISPRVPRQLNECDCGVYVLEYVERLFDKLDTVFTQNMAEINEGKMKIVLERVFGEKWFDGKTVAAKRRSIGMHLKQIMKQ